MSEFSRTQLGAIDALKTLAVEAKSVKFTPSEGAATDGSTVYLPCADGASGAVERAGTIGSGLHELMHVRQTDMQAIKNLKADEMLLTNVLEDVRIDKLGTLSMPGYDFWRRQVIEANRLQGTLRMQAIEGMTRAQDILAVWLHCTMLEKNGLDWLSEWQDAADAKAKSFFGEDFLEGIELYVYGQRCESTADCIKMARTIKRRLSRWLNQSKNTNGQTGRRNKKQTEGEGWDPSSMTLKTVTPSSQDCRSQSSSGDCTANSESGEAEKLPEPASYGEPEELLRSERMISDDAKYYAEAFLKQTQTVALNKRRLDRVLPKAEVCEDDIASTGVGIADFVPYAAQRSTLIFSCQKDRERRSAGHVLVLVDRSGSMGVRTMTMAKCATAALTAALDKFEHVASEVLAFPALDNKYCAWIKKAEESHKQYLTRLSMVSAFGSTPFEPALAYCRQHLRDVKEANKLLIVITDGRVSPFDKGNLEREFADVGTELALLSINVANDKICRNYVHVNSADKIADALIGLIRNAKFRKALVG